MKGTFKNLNKKNSNNPEELCLHDHVENSDIEIDDIEKSKIHSSRLLVEKKYLDLKTVKNTRSSTPPYIDPTPEEIIYLPVVFHQFRSANATDKSDQYPDLAHHIIDTETYTDAFYIEVVEYLNSFLAGTHADPNRGTLGNLKDNVDHGVVSKLRFVIAPKIPQSYFLNFLNGGSRNNLPTYIDSIDDSYFFQQVSQEDESTSYTLYEDLSFSNFSSIKNIVAFQYTNIILEKNLYDANLDLENAQNLLTSIYDSYIEEGESHTSSLNLATNESNLKYFEYLVKNGGFIDCGPNGAIFTYNTDKYDPCRLNLLNTSSTSSDATCEDLTCVNNLDDYGNCTTSKNTSILAVAKIRDYSGIGDAEATELGTWGNTLPTANVYTTMDDSAISIWFSGYGPSPGMSVNGSVFMNKPSDTYSNYSNTKFSAYGFAQILLHEFGHSFGLPHTFQGGSINQLHDKVFPKFNFKHILSGGESSETSEETLDLAVINFNFPSISDAEYTMSKSATNIFTTNVVKETIYFSDIIHNDICFPDYGLELAVNSGVISRGSSTFQGYLDVNTIFLPVQKLENMEGNNMHIPIYLTSYGMQILSPDNTSKVFSETLLNAVEDSVIGGGTDFILAEPGDTLVYKMHAATHFDNTKLSNYFPSAFSIRTCNFIPPLWAAQRANVIMPIQTGDTFSIKRNNVDGSFKLNFKAYIVQFWDSNLLEDFNDAHYNNQTVQDLAEQLNLSSVVVEGVILNEDSTEEIQIIKSFASDANKFTVAHFWERGFVEHRVQYEAIITEPFDAIRIRSIGETEVHFMEFTCLAVSEDSSRTFTDNRILLDDRSNSYLSQDEKTFIDLFYSQVYNNTHNKKLKFSTDQNGNKITDSYEEDFSDSEITEQTRRRDSLFQLPFFYDGSIDTSKINGLENFPLVFNKILNLYKNINATDFELKGGISTTLIDETRNATTSYINENNNWVLSSSTSAFLNYQTQAKKYTEILGTGVQADYEKISVNINTYNLDYTPIPNTTKLILELENPARPIAIKEYFTDNEGNSLGTKISDTFFWGAYTDADSLGFLNGKPNLFSLLSNADNTNYVGTELGPNVTLEFDIADVTSSIEIIVADMPATHTFLTTTILSASIVRNSRPINTLTRMPFCELDANGNPTDVFDEFWDFNLNWLNQDYPAYPDNWPTDKAYDEFDDNGNSLCPCLYAAQKYQHNNSSIITDGSIGSLTSALRTISRNSEGNAKKGFGSVYTSGFLSGEKGLYESQYYTFSKGKFYFANGHSPLFGFYGFSPLQGMPSSYDLDIGNLNDIDFYTKDDLLSDTPRIQKKGPFGFSEISFRYYIGSSDPQSLNYNPYKVPENTNVTVFPLFSLDAVNKNEESNVNPIMNLPTSTGVYNSNMMRHCMNYNVSVQNVSEGEIQYNETASMHALRTAYSVEGVFRIEAIVESGRGKWGKIVDYGKFLGLGENTVYSETNDAQTTLIQVENYIETGELITGCTDPQAANYNSAAQIDNNSCMYPEDEDCIFPEARIIVCDINDSLLLCNYVSEEILNLFVGELTLTPVVYTDEYPQPPEGCTGGGVRYMKASALIAAGNPTGADIACIEGNPVNENCVAGANASPEDVEAAVLSSNYTLVCDNTTTRLTENNYTYGDRYFNKDGKSYQGLYCTRGQDFVYSGSLKERGERLYKQIDTTKTYKDSNSLKDVAKNFDRIRKNIQNICKFVKL